MLRTFAAASLLALTCGAPALAAEEAAGATAEAGTVAIRDAYVKATVGQATASAAYMTLVNRGDAVERLVGAASPAAEAVELHAHAVGEDGVMRMRPVEAVEIEPGAETALEPGGLHLMLVGLDRPLDEGATFPLTLTFAGAGEVELDLPVRSILAIMRQGAGDRGGGSVPRK